MDCAANSGGSGCGRHGPSGRGNHMLSSDDPRHGTMNGYCNLCCRCLACRRANREHQQQYIAEIRSRGRTLGRHGTRVAYTSGCRCLECREAQCCKEPTVSPVEKISPRVVTLIRIAVRRQRTTSQPFPLDNRPNTNSGKVTQGFPPPRTKFRSVIPAGQPTRSLGRLCRVREGRARRASGQ